MPNSYVEFEIFYQVTRELFTDIPLDLLSLTIVFGWHGCDGVCQGVIIRS